MWRQRRQRAELYSTAEYWDAKARSLTGQAVSMWPNNHLNALYEDEQRACLDAALGQVAGREILDIGCGTGRISRYLAGRGAQVVAFDFARDAVEIARRTPGPEVTYLVQSVFDLDEDERYDAAVSWGTLTVACRNEYELGDALSRIRGALRRGGTVALLEPIHSGFLSRVLSMGLQDFCAVMRTHGFRIERVEQLHFWPARLALAFYEVPRPITRLGYWIGQGLMKLPGLRRLGDYKGLVARAE
jgi:cyclopropane fatty-acyl-phospholipid synthase-like methyltransferase